MTVLGGLVSKSSGVRLALASLAFLLPAGSSWAQSFLTRSSKCDDASLAIQTNSSKFGDADLRKLADECMAKAAAADSKKSAAISAYNAGRLYNEGSRRSSDTARKLEMLSLAERAQNASLRELDDAAPQLANGTRGANKHNASVKFYRTAILAGAKLEQGLLSVSPASAKCLNEEQCLPAGLRLLDIGGTLTRTVDPAVYDRLQLLGAKAQEKLTPENLDRVLEPISGVLSLSSDQQTLSEARTSLVALTTGYAERTLTNPPTAQTLASAIRYLERAKRDLGASASSAAAKSEISALLGAVYARRAEMYPPGPSAQRETDLCSAVRVYREQLTSSPAAIGDEMRIRLSEGLGAAAIRLARNNDVVCDGRRKADLESDALQAFNSAWALRKQSNSEAASPVAALHVSLLVARGTAPEEALISAISRRAGEDEMRAHLDLAKFALSIRPFSDAARLRADQHFGAASAAFPSSPEPELEQGKFYYALAESGAPVAAQYRSSAGQLLAGAVRKSENDRGAFAKLQAEAYYYRSLNEMAMNVAAGPGVVDVLTSRKNAFDWAMMAWRTDSANAAYGYQACRAHLFNRASGVGEGKTVCELNKATIEGSILHAMLQFRDAQVRVKGSRTAPPESKEIFRQVELAFDEARRVWDRSRSPMTSTVLEWPGFNPKPDVGKIIDYGKAISFACSVDDTQAPRPPADVVSNSEALFKKAALYKCIGIE